SSGYAFKQVAQQTGAKLTFGKGFLSGIQNTFSGSVFKAASFPFMNTVKSAVGSTVNSAFNSLAYGGDVSTSIGFASFNWSKGTGSILGGRGNSKLENWGYTFGAMGFLQDALAGVNGTNVTVRARTKLAGHSEVNGKGINISVGPDEFFPG